MAATVKTLLEHHGELYWGTRKANPGYCYGLALDVGADGLAAELVYVMSDLDENDEPLVTPETLVSCFTVNDLEDNGIILSNYLDDEDAPEAVGWYCIEKSFFGRDNVEALLDNNARLDGHLDIVLQILLISPEEVAQGMPSLDELSFFDLLEELEGVAERIDCPFRSASWATRCSAGSTPTKRISAKGRRTAGVHVFKVLCAAKSRFWHTARSVRAFGRASRLRVPSSPQVGFRIIELSPIRRAKTPILTPPLTHNARRRALCDHALRAVRTNASNRRFPHGPGHGGAAPVAAPARRAGTVRPSAHARLCQSFQRAPVRFG